MISWRTDPPELGPGWKGKTRYEVKTSTYMFAVRSWNKGAKVVIINAAKRKLEGAEVNKLAPFPARRLLGVGVHPNHAVDMEHGGVGFAGVLLCMLHAVDTLVLLEVGLS